MKQIVVIVALLLGLAADAWAQTRIAFVAGVERYNKSGLNDLSYAEDDALQVKAALEKLGFKTFSVIGNDAGLAKLNRELDSFIRATKELNKSDIALVYFSGHGVQKLVQRTSNDGRTVEVEEPFFCPNDAIKTDVNTLLSLNTLLKRLEDSSGSDHNIIMLDACRDSADKSGKGGIDGSTIRELSDKLALFFAAKSGRRSFESKQLGHGIFTHYLLEGLRGRAADGDDEITFQSLVSYVSKQVERNSPELLEVPAAEAQRPNVMANLSGTIILGKVNKSIGFADRSVIEQTNLPFVVLTTRSQLEWNSDGYWMSLRPIEKAEWDKVMDDTIFTFEFLDDQTNAEPYLTEFCRKLTLLEIKAGRLPFEYRYFPTHIGDDTDFGYKSFRIYISPGVGYYHTRTTEEWQLLLPALLRQILNDAELKPLSAMRLLFDYAAIDDQVGLAQMRDSVIKRLEQNGFFQKNDPTENIYKAGILWIGGDIATLEKTAQTCERFYPKQITNDTNDRGSLTDWIVVFIINHLTRQVTKQFPSPPELRAIALIASLKRFCKEHEIKTLDELNAINQAVTITANPVGDAEDLLSNPRKKVVVAYAFDQSSGAACHPYAFANSLYEKWKDHSIDFLIVNCEGDSFTTESIDYFKQTMPKWKLASIRAQEPLNSFKRGEILVIDKNHQIKFRFGRSFELYSDPYLDKAIESSLGD